MLTDRLTDPQIVGLETWLEAVDPHKEVMAPQLVLDAIQALIEEVREWRAGALGAADVETLRSAWLAIRRGRGRQQHPGLKLIERILAAHGAKP